MTGTLDPLFKADGSDLDRVWDSGQIKHPGYMSFLCSSMI